MFFENRKPDSAWGYDEYYYKSNIKKIEKISHNFIKIISSNKLPTPKFYDIFMFNCLRSKTFTSKVDYDFWNKKGWLNSNYFYETGINLLKKAFGGILKVMINVLGKKIKNKTICNEQ